MTWQTAVVPRERLVLLLADIRRLGGTVIRSQPAAEGLRVTWTSADATMSDVLLARWRADLPASRTRADRSPSSSSTTSRDIA